MKPPRRRASGHHPFVLVLDCSGNAIEKFVAEEEMNEQNIDRIDRGNHWLAVAANIGVVLGLIMLIVEVRQNAALTALQLTAERHASEEGAEAMLVGGNGAEVWGPE